MPTLVLVTSSRRDAALVDAQPRTTTVVVRKAAPAVVRAAVTAADPVVVADTAAVKEAVDTAAAKAVETTVRAVAATVAAKVVDTVTIALRSMTATTDHHFEVARAAVTVVAPAVVTIVEVAAGVHRTGMAHQTVAVAVGAMTAKLTNLRKPN